MKKFKFRFSKLLDIKRKKEDILKEDMARLDLSIEKSKMELVKLRDKLKTREKGLRALYANPTTIEDILNNQRALALRRREIEEEQRRLESMLRERRILADRVLKAMKERKILEKLQDKKQADFKREALLAEQKITDEVASKRRYKVI